MLASPGWGGGGKGRLPAAATHLSLAPVGLSLMHGMSDVKI